MNMIKMLGAVFCKCSPLFAMHIFCFFFSCFFVIDRDSIDLLLPPGRHFTREALPRLDNYRDILSIQAVYRPTLDDLHNATMSNKVSD